MLLNNLKFHNTMPTTKKPATMAKIHLKVGLEYGTIYRYYNCGESGELHDAALNLDNENSDSISQFVKNNFKSPYIEHTIISTANGKEEYAFITVGDTDEDWMLIEGTNGPVLGDPNKWEYSEGVDRTIIEAGKDYATRYESVINKLINEEGYSQKELANDDTMAQALSDTGEGWVISEDLYSTDGIRIQDLCYHTDKNKAARESLLNSLFIVERVDSEGAVAYEGDIDIDEGEAFDPSKLHLQWWDNDGELVFVEGYHNCILPTIKYGNKFYRLNLNSFPQKTSLFKITEIEENSYFHDYDIFDIASDERVSAWRLRYEEIESAGYGLWGVMKNGKWGFANESGEVLIKPKFSSRGDYVSDEMIAVQVDGKYGFINSKGQEVIPPIYDSVTGFSDGRAAVVLDGESFQINKKGENLSYLRKLIDGNGHIIIPNGVTEIYEYAFNELTELTQITIPNSVKKIGKSAFKGCIRLRSIVLPDKITGIRESTFEGCIGLTNVQFPSGLKKIENKAFSGCVFLSEITMPSNTVKIHKNAFDGCVDLKINTGDAELPNKVNTSSISNKERSVLGDITLLPEGGMVVGLKESGTLRTSILENNIDMSSVKCITFKGVDLNEDDKNIIRIISKGYGLLEKLDFQEVEMKSASGFNGMTSVTEIILPNNITTIEDRTFRGCSALTQITIPDSVTSIGDYAFWGCKSLTQIRIPYGITKIGWMTFADCKALNQVAIPDSVTSIEREAFMNCKSLVQIVIPNSVTWIACGAFSGCSALKQITIPYGDEAIWGEAFMNCKSLAQVTIPNSVTRILTSAFIYCNSLTQITIPESVTLIDEFAFYSCHSLSHVKITSKTPIRIGSDAFKYCDANLKITVPKDSIQAYKESWNDYLDNLVESEE